MRITKASGLVSTLHRQRGNKYNETEKLLDEAAFFMKYNYFFLLDFAFGLNSRQRFTHLSRSSSRSIPSGETYK